MIRADISNTGIRVTGHAPRRPGESDNIVCAAVSALTLTLVDALEEIAGENVSRETYEPGNVTARFDFRSFGVTGRALLAAYIMGTTRIGESYPGTIIVSDTRGLACDYDMADGQPKRGRESADDQPMGRDGKERAHHAQDL